LGKHGHDILQICTSELQIAQKLFDFKNLTPLKRKEFNYQDYRSWTAAVHPLKINSRIPQFYIKYWRYRDSRKSHQKKNRFQFLWLNLLYFVTRFSTIFIFIVNSPVEFEQ